MEFLGIDLTKLTGLNAPPLTPETLVKDFPLELLTKPLCPIGTAPGIDVQCETSWFSDVGEMLMDVWRQPMTQIVGISIVVTGITVCSWKLSQYWDIGPGEDTRGSKRKHHGLETRLQAATRTRTVRTRTSGKPSCDEADDGRLKALDLEHLDANLSLFKHLEREGFQNRMGKVIWRVRDIVKDLRQLDGQRETLQVEIQRHRQTCSKLQELGDLERSKRQAAEDKVKMIETENLQLKKLNQIIAKKASLIDKLEGIIKEKNALEFCDPKASLQWTRDVVATQGGFCLHADDRKVKGISGSLEHTDEPFVLKGETEQELKHKFSQSSCSEKGDQSPSVIVLSEDDNVPLPGRPSPRWTSPSPIDRVFPVRPHGVASASSSLTSVSKQNCHKRQRRSKSSHGSTNKRDSVSPRKIVGLRKPGNEEKRLSDVTQINSLEVNAETDIHESANEEAKRESFELNRGTTQQHDQDNVVVKSKYKFDAAISPPKYHLRQVTSQDNATSCSLEDVTEDKEISPDSLTECNHEALKNDAEKSPSCQKLDSSLKATVILHLHADKEIPVCIATQQLQAETIAGDRNDNPLPDLEEELLNNEEPLNLVTRIDSQSGGDDGVLEPSRPAPREAGSPRGGKAELEGRQEEVPHPGSHERPQDGRTPSNTSSSLFPGIPNVFKKANKRSSPKKSAKKASFPAVRFVNRAGQESVGSDEEGEGERARKGDDTWVVIMDGQPVKS